MRVEPRTFLRMLYGEAVKAADPASHLQPSRLPGHPHGRTVVVGAGKAAARMAGAVEKGWRGALEGIVVTRYGHGEPCERVEVVEAAHPLPDAAGLDATIRILQLVQDLTPHDLVICLLSGGGSALLELPVPGIVLSDNAVGRALLREHRGDQLCAKALVARQGRAIGRNGSSGPDHHLRLGRARRRSFNCCLRPNCPRRNDFRGCRHDIGALWHCRACFCSSASASRHGCTGG